PCSLALCDLHSFPTRRSSDLRHQGTHGLGALGKLECSNQSMLGPVYLTERAHLLRRDIGAQSIRRKRDCPGSTPHDKLRDDLVLDRKSTRLNSSHSQISYAVF